MKIAVFGAGLMGRAAAWDMVRSAGVEKVLLLDGDEKQLREGSAFAGNVEAQVCDAGDLAAARAAIEGCNVVVSCVPYRYNRGLAEICIDAGAGMVDLGGNNDVVDAQFALSDRARERGVTIIPDCGLAPGMASIWAMAGADELDECESIRMLCGGLPVHPQPPLNYMRLFSMGGLINEYIEPCRIIVDGVEQLVDGMSGLEEVSFPAPFEKMEAFYTSGGTSTLVKTLKPRVRSLEYKTVRYPGHIQHFRVIHAIGLTRSDEIGVDGARVAPRRLLEKLLQDYLPDSGPDVTLLRVDCTGTLDGAETLVRHQLIDYADEKNGHSSMMRCTSFPATAIARMIGDGTIAMKGTQPQELVVPAETLRAELAKRGIKVERSITAR
jgi:lysine 6-dehydrogenase